MKGQSEQAGNSVREGVERPRDDTVIDLGEIGADDDDGGEGEGEGSSAGGGDTAIAALLMSKTPISDSLIEEASDAVEGMDVMMMPIFMGVMKPMMDPIGAIFGGESSEPPLCLALALDLLSRVGVCGHSNPFSRCVRFNCGRAFQPDAKHDQDGHADRYHRPDPAASQPRAGHQDP
jgi:hypothetical protein